MHYKIIRIGKSDFLLPRKSQLSTSDQSGNYSLNKIGTPPWWIYSKLLGSIHINKVTLKIFDKTVWFWRRIDRWLPWAGLTLVLVARKQDSRAPATGEMDQLAELRFQER